MATPPFGLQTIFNGQLPCRDAGAFPKQRRAPSTAAAQDLATPRKFEI